MVINLECLIGMRMMIADNSIDAVVTDPPYGLSKQPDMNEVLRHWLNGDDYVHTGSGFMGKSWDSFVPGPSIWKEVFRVLKPGGHLLAFFGTRTYDLGTLAIRLAGFEIRDQIDWVYGSGFPKSLDISKAIDKQDASELKRRKQLVFTKWMRENNLTSKFINEVTNTNMGGHYLTDSSQPAIATREHFEKLRPFFILKVPVEIEKMVDERTEESINFKNRDIIGIDTKARSTNSNSALPTCGEGETIYQSWDITAPATDEAKQWQGWGTALKPAHEPICVARKPLTGTVAENVLQFGTGGMNIDDCRIPTEDKLGGGMVSKGRPKVSEGWDRPWMHNAEITEKKKIEAAKKVADAEALGRWPANFIHDGSDEVVSLLPGGSERYFYCAKASKSDRDEGVMLAMVTAAEMTDREPDTDGLNSPRAGAGRTSGARNNHPTVKPTALMQWLVRLVTPPGGKVLDPFTGSGSTGKACAIEGFDFIGFEMDPHYCEIAKQRIAYVNNR